MPVLAYELSWLRMSAAGLALQDALSEHASMVAESARDRVRHAAARALRSSTVCGGIVGESEALTCDAIAEETDGKLAGPQRGARGRVQAPPCCPER